MKTKLGVIYGGKSAEHEVSLLTARAVMNALDDEKYDIYPIFITKDGEWIQGKKITEEVTDVSQLQFVRNGSVLTPLDLQFVGHGENSKYDVIFPFLHGPNGEDGTVQGLLELLNIPYVGNGVLASAAGMDKVVMKQLFAQAGLPQPKFTWYLRNQWEEDKAAVCEDIEIELGYPCFVKPANLGSSVGISKAVNREELEKAFDYALKFDRKIIVEEGIEGRELEVSVMGNEDPKCSIIGEILPTAKFYDYEAKYVTGDTGLAIPADISEDVVTRMKSKAIRAYKALDCSGLARADFFLSIDGELLVNELNTMPGFTPISMYPMLWKETGMTYPEIIENLIQLGIQRYNEKQKIQHCVTGEE